jgi:hypothetical protein
VLNTTGTVHDGKTLRYRASKFDCEVCALKTQCCPNGRRVKFLAMFMNMPAT